MLLADKVAIVYGAGGQIGAATAREFARQGAMVYCVGRSIGKVQATVDGIRADAGRAVAAELDAFLKPP